MARKFAYMDGVTFETMKAYVEGAPLSEQPLEYNDLTAPASNQDAEVEEDGIVDGGSSIDVGMYIQDI